MDPFYSSGHQNPHQQMTGGGGGNEQLTLTQLNSPTENDFASNAAASAATVTGAVKMETNDFDDLDLFLTNSSPNVSFGLQDVKPATGQHFQVKQEVLRPHHLQQLPQQHQYNPTTLQLANPNFWQASTDELLFGHASASAPTGAAAAAQMSSSVPIIANPLSDILTELNPGNCETKLLPSTATTASTPPLSVVPSSQAGTVNATSPSQVGPTRHSTLHRLLMQRGKSDVAAAQAAAAAAAVGASTTATKSRPSPVRSPEARKTLDQMRTSLSSGVSMLSRSAPSTSSSLVAAGLNASANAAGGEPSRNVWARREPRPHINSVCSVGDASSIADEVNDVLQGLSPAGVDLQDIASDDEEGGYLDKDSSDGIYFCVLSNEYIMYFPSRLFGTNTGPFSEMHGLLFFRRQ